MAKKAPKYDEVRFHPSSMTVTHGGFDSGRIEMDGEEAVWFPVGDGDGWRADDLQAVANKMIEMEKQAGYR